MKKQMISFTDSQHAYLKKQAKHYGISVAELVRRHVDGGQPNRFDCLVDFIDEISEQARLVPESAWHLRTFAGTVSITPYELRYLAKIRQSMPRRKGVVRWPAPLGVEESILQSLIPKIRKRLRSDDQLRLRPSNIGWDFELTAETRSLFVLHRRLEKAVLPVIRSERDILKG